MLKRRIVMTLAIVLIALVSFEFETAAQQERFFDIIGEVTYGEECLQTWQIDEASAVANKLLLIAPGNPYVCFFAGEVRFYEGNYQESLSLLKDARKEPFLEQKSQEFYDFVIRFTKQQASLKRLRLNTFSFGITKTRMPYWLIMP